MHEARFYRTADDGAVLCQLCAQSCRIEAGRHGLCGVRKNVDGVLVSEVYGKAAAGHVDPIEKKPLFHVYPGSLAMSVATVGCNFRCEFCQNWDLSQAAKGPSRHIVGQDMSPEDVADRAQRQRCRIVAFTYTEPTIFYEWAFNTAREAASRGMINVFVTNGYIAAEPLRQIQPYLHAANVDLKAFSDDTYRKIMGATAGVGPVLETLKLMKALGIWVEVTTLVVPGMNDSDDELREIARFIAGELGEQTPWHVSRFHPDYKFTSSPPTPAQTLRRASEAGAEAGLRYVYVGNVVGGEGEDTVCHGCGRTLVRRAGFRIIGDSITSIGRCPECGAAVAGIGMGKDPLPAMAG